MNCEKVQDQFSSFREKELTASEERIVREHLSSCTECQREFGRFEKTMRWLHSVGEEEVPDGFVSELYKKMEERKGKAVLSQETKGRWFAFPISLKLPVQAAAMVAIVFLALYLTKMMPIEVSHMKPARQTPFPLPSEKKSEQVLAQKEMEKERRATEIPPEAPLPKEVEQTKAPAPGEGRLEGATLPKAKAEARKAEVPPPKTEVLSYPTIDSKDVARPKVSSPEPGKIGQGWVAKEKSVVASKPPQEIILRISDRQKVIFQLQELVKQFEGEIVSTDENMFLASLPNSSLPEFEKELAGLSASIKIDKGVAQKHVAGSLKATLGAKREEVDGKRKESSRLEADQESRTLVHILLIQE